MTRTPDARRVLAWDAAAPVLDRRRFLALGSALVALSCGAGAARPKQRARVRKCLKLSMVHGEASLEEKFRLLVELGFEGVEVESPSDLDPDEVIAARDASGLAVPGVIDSVHWRVPLGDPDPAVRAEGRAGLERALADAARFGASTVLLVPAVVNARTAYDVAWENSRSEIGRVLPLAEELGVRIAIENVWNHFILSPLEAVRYVDSFESEWVGWYLDVGNVLTYGWPEQWVRILGKRLLRVDVKEFSRKKRDSEGLGKGFDVPLGEGDVDWSAVMAALDALDYDGWGSAELPGGDADHLRDVSRRMDDVLAR